MAGNVWEMCSDGYQEDYYRVSPERNPTGPKLKTGRVIRGGSFTSAAGALRCANRMRWIDPGTVMLDRGFRCVQDRR
jgi:formylglycine-generating enzyme required for sulfatase activity